MPMRTQSRKNTTRQIKVETADLDEMAEFEACKMEGGSSSSQGIGGKRPRSEPSEAGMETEEPQRKRRKEAALETTIYNQGNV